MKNKHKKTIGVDLNKDDVDENKEESHFEKQTKVNTTVPLIRNEEIYRFSSTIGLWLDIFKDSTAAFILKGKGKPIRVSGAIPFDEIKKENLINGILLKLKTKYKLHLKKKKSIVMKDIMATIENKLQDIHVTKIKISTDQGTKLDSDENKVDSKNSAPEENTKTTSFEKETHFDDKPETISDGEHNITTDNNNDEKNIEKDVNSKLLAIEMNSKILAKEGVNSKILAIEMNSKLLANEEKKSNIVTGVANDLDMNIAKEKDENKEIDNSKYLAKEKVNSKLLTHSSNKIKLNDFTIVSSMLLAKEENGSSIFALMSKHLTIESIEVLKAIVKFEYFTENMIIVESNIKQRTVNNNLNSWVDIALLKRTQDPTKYKIHNNARPFYIYFWNDLPEPFPETEAHILRIQQTLRLNWWKKATPSEKLLKWVNQSYSMLSSTRLRETERIIPKSSDEQRQLLFKKAERYGVRLNDPIYQLLDHRTFTVFKEFRKQLTKLVEGHDLDIATEKDKSPIKRKKKKGIKFTCAECNRSTYQSKQPKKCPYDNCEGITFVEGVEGE